MRARARSLMRCAATVAPVPGARAPAAETGREFLDSAPARRAHHGEMESNRGLGVGLVLAAALLWGTTGTAQSFASPELSAGWFGALRLVVAAAFFAAYAALAD